MLTFITSFQSSWQNVINGHGIDTSITGMSIVFSSLIIISLCVTAVPHILVVFNKFFPEKVEKPKPVKASAANPDEVVAAIGLALHNSLQTTNK